MPTSRAAPPTDGGHRARVSRILVRPDPVVGSRPGHRPSPLFRLLGLSGSEATRTPLTALPRVVEAQVDQAEIVDDMLGQLLASFDYDLPALHTVLHEPVDTASEENTPGQAPSRRGRSTSLHAESAGAEGYPPQPDRRRRAVCVAPTPGVPVRTDGNGNGRRGKQTG